jgi:hypothetical protein
MLKPRRPAWMRALDLGSMCQSPCSSYDDYAASQNERRNRGFGRSGRARHLPQRGERLLQLLARLTLNAGSTLPTSQLDWLISTTAITVLSWSRATRDWRESFGWGIRVLHQLDAATMVPSPRRLPDTISPLEKEGFTPTPTRFCSTSTLSSPKWSGGGFSRGRERRWRPRRRAAPCWAIERTLRWRAGWARPRCGRRLRSSVRRGSDHRRHRRQRGRYRRGGRRGAQGSRRRDGGRWHAQTVKNVRARAARRAAEGRSCD